MKNGKTVKSLEENMNKHWKKIEQQASIQQADLIFRKSEQGYKNLKTESYNIQS